MVPVKALQQTLKYDNCVNNPNSDGMVPTKAILCNAKYVSWVNIPISVGMVLCTVPTVDAPVYEVILEHTVMVTSVKN